VNRALLAPLTPDEEHRYFSNVLSRIIFRLDTLRTQITSNRIQTDPETQQASQMDSMCDPRQYIDPLIESISGRLTMAIRGEQQLREDIGSIDARLKVLENNASIPLEPTTLSSVYCVFEHRSALAVLRTRKYYRVFEEDAISPLNPEYQARQTSGRYALDATGQFQLTDNILSLYSYENYSHVNEFGRDPAHYPASLQIEEFMALMAKFVPGTVRWSNEEWLRPSDHTVHYVDHVNMKTYLDKFKPGIINFSDGSRRENFLDEWSIAWPHSFDGALQSGYYGLLGSTVAADTDTDTLGTISDLTDRGTVPSISVPKTTPDVSTLPHPETMSWRVTGQPEQTFYDTEVGRVVSNIFSTLDVTVRGVLPLLTSAAFLAGTAGILFDIDELSVAGTELVTNAQLLSTKISAWDNGMAAIGHSSIKSFTGQLFEQIIPRIDTHIASKGSIESVGFVFSEPPSWNLEFESELPPFVSGTSACSLPRESTTLYAGPFRNVLEISKISRYTSDTDWNGQNIVRQVAVSVPATEAHADGHNVILFDGLPVATKQLQSGREVWIPTRVTGGALRT
jgi:hypothetical protein